MSTTRLHSLAEQYLGQLQDAARVLPDEDREELLAEVRGHLEAGLPDDPSDAQVRNLIQDLGSPADIVASAGPESGQVRATAPPAGPWGAVEILAVLGLTVGTFLLPIVGPIIGMCLAWTSPRWTRREKTIATVLAFLPLLALVLGLAVSMAVSVNGSTGHTVPSAPVPHRIVGAAS